MTDSTSDAGTHPAGSPTPSPGPGGHIALSGLVSLAGYVYAVVGLRGYGQARDVGSFLALFAGLFAIYFLTLRWTRASPRVGPILLWALLFRLAMLPAGLPRDGLLEALGDDLTSEAVGYRTFLLYDNDVWRYLWDGHMASGGFDPYSWNPAEVEALAEDGDPDALALFEEELWQDVFDNVSFHRYTTVYPPLAQFLFRGLHAVFPGSVFVLKLVLVAFDFGTCLILVRVLRSLGRNASAVVIYAWNPLAVKEIAGSGHVDAMMIFFLLAAIALVLRGRRRAGLAAFGLAILSKVTPVLLVGLFLRRSRLKDWPVLPLVLTAAYLPFLSSWIDILKGLTAMAREWVFNPGPWALWKLLAEAVGLPGRTTASAVSGVLTLAILGWVVFRDDACGEGLVRGSFAILGSYLVLSATVMPWYLLWVLPFAAVFPTVSWRVLTCLSLLSYLVYVDQVEHPWWLWTEFVTFFLLLAWEARRGIEARNRQAR